MRPFRRYRRRSTSIGESQKGINFVPFILAHLSPVLVQILTFVGSLMAVDSNQS